MPGLIFISATIPAFFNQTQAKMKYQIKKGCELFDKLTELNERMLLVHKTAQEYATSLGGGKVATTGRYLSGGIDAIEFEKKPEGWRHVGRDYQMLFYPKTSLKKVIEEIRKLPIIEFDELNALVGFSAPQTVSNANGLTWVKSVSMYWHKNFILMETVDGTTYNPIENVVEILGSEFDKLLKLIKN